jgi:hypothetical protein
MSNGDRRDQKTVWDILPLLAMIGSLITAWVNLNGTITAIQTKQEYDVRLATLRFDNINKKILKMENQVSQMLANNKEVMSNVNDLERSVTQLYNTKRKRTSK